MGNLTLVQDEREIINAYKRVTAARAQAESDAIAALKRAEAEASKKQKAALAAAEQIRDDAQKRAEKEIKLARTYLNEINSTLQTLSFLPNQLQGSSSGAGSSDAEAVAETAALEHHLHG